MGIKWVEAALCVTYVQLLTHRNVAVNTGCALTSPLYSFSSTSFVILFFKALVFIYCFLFTYSFHQGSGFLPAPACVLAFDTCKFLKKMSHNLVSFDQRIRLYSNPGDMICS